MSTEFSPSRGLLAIAASLLLEKRDPSSVEVEDAKVHGLPRGKCHSWKQALQIFLGRLDVAKSDVVYKGTSLLVPAAEEREKIVLDAHGEMHLSVRNTWKEVRLFLLAL